MLDKIREKILTLIEPRFDEWGFELVELAVNQRKQTIVFSVLAEKPKGITLDECAFINRHISRLLEDENPIAEDWVVEVASPGLDRPLTNPADFRRIQGRNVRVHLKEKIAQKMEHSGDILKVDDTDLTLRTKNGEVTIPLNSIETGKQIIKT